MFKRTLHLNLIVSDFDRSHQFYTKVLGFEEVMQFKIDGPGFQKGVGIVLVCFGVSWCLQR